MASPFLIAVAAEPQLTSGRRDLRSGLSASSVWADDPGFPVYKSALREPHVKQSAHLGLAIWAGDAGIRISAPFRRDEEADQDKAQRDGAPRPVVTVSQPVQREIVEWDEYSVASKPSRQWKCGRAVSRLAFSTLVVAANSSARACSSARINERWSMTNGTSTLLARPDQATPKRETATLSEVARAPRP